MSACQCVAEHRPALGGMIQSHHILPLAWMGPNTAANRIQLCPNGHELVHRTLNVIVRNGPARGVPWTELPTRNRYLLGLAERALVEYLARNGGLWPTRLTLHRDEP